MYRSNDHARGQKEQTSYTCADLDLKFFYVATFLKWLKVKTVQRGDKEERQTSRDLCIHQVTYGYIAWTMIHLLLMKYFLQTTPHTNALSCVLPDSTKLYTSVVCGWVGGWTLSTAPSSSIVSVQVSFQSPSSALSNMALKDCIPQPIQLDLFRLRCCRQYGDTMKGLCLLECMFLTWLCLHAASYVATLVVVWVHVCWFCTHACVQLVRIPVGRRDRVLWTLWAFHEERVVSFPAHHFR